MLPEFPFFIHKCSVDRTDLGAPPAEIAFPPRADRLCECRMSRIPHRICPCSVRDDMMYGSNEGDFLQYCMTRVQ